LTISLKNNFFIFKIGSCERYATFERQDLYVFLPFLKPVFFGSKTFFTIRCKMSRNVLYTS